MLIMMNDTLTEEQFLFLKLRLSTGTGGGAVRKEESPPSRSGAGETRWGKTQATGQKRRASDD